MIFPFHPFSNYETNKSTVWDSEDRKIRTYSDDLMNLSIDHPPSRQSSEARARPRIRSGSFLHPVMVAEDMSIRQQWPGNAQLWRT